jgi:uncharacterized protein (TIGR02001 family)
VSQTWGGPALQGEIELEHNSGLYAGAFASNVSRKTYPGGAVELELWSGYEHELTAESTVTVEGIYYAYPGANFRNGNCAARSCASQSFDTFQARVGATWRWLNTRFGYTLSDYFGDSARTGFTGSTRGTWYWEANADYPLPRAPTWHLLAHVGRTHYTARFAFPDPRVTEDPDYWDLRIGVTKYLSDSLKGWRAGLYYTQASNRSFHETASLTSAETRDLGRPSLILALDWTF